MSDQIRHRGRSIRSLICQPTDCASVFLVGEMHRIAFRLMLSSYVSVCLCVCVCVCRSVHRLDHDYFGHVSATKIVIGRILRRRLPLVSTGTHSHSRTTCLIQLGPTPTPGQCVSFHTFVFYATRNLKVNFEPLRILLIYG